MPRSLRVPALLAFALAAACSNPNAIPSASLSNTLDTLTLWSLEKGPLNKPTAYSLNARNGVRTWEVGTNFEFLFSVDAAGHPRFIPLGALGLSSTGSVKPGLLKTSLSFDSMVIAPQNGYLTTDTLPIAIGDRFFVRTAVNTCALLGVPLYGKVEVLAIDTSAITVQIRVVGDQNCGYRGLRLGIPGS
jgi:hypothetical protein